LLFDLRGRGRRRTIKVVYITLAFLMGGGLVLFGIGGDVSGGLVDAITERGGGGDGDDRFKDRERQAAERTRANPQDARAWADLARARYQRASTGDGFDAEKNTYTEEGLSQLRSAAQAWERHLALDPPKPDDRVASLMVGAYTALNDPAKATTAQEVVTAARPSSGTYANLAVLAYAAGQTRKGDLAAQKALDETEPDMREALKSELERAKQQGAGAASGGSADPGQQPAG